MIKEAKIVGDEVHAVGDRYEMDKILGAVSAFLRGFVAEALAETPSAVAKLDLDGLEAGELDADDGWLADFYLRAPGAGLIGRGVATIDAGKYRVRLRLTGPHALLLRKGDAAPTTLYDRGPAALEIEPDLVVLRNDGSGRMATRAEDEAVLEMVRRHAPPGTEADRWATPRLRFPHAAFGAGEGPIRIALVRAA